MNVVAGDALVLFAHGARDARWSASLNALEAAIRAHASQASVRTAFLARPCFLRPNPAPDLSLFPWRDHRVQQFAPAHHPNRAQPRDPRVVEQAAQLADR